MTKNQRKGMTRNQSKAEAFLKKIREGERILKTKRNELDALQYKASRSGAIRYDNDHVQTTPQNYLEMAIDDIIEIKKQIDEIETETEEIKSKAYSIVRTLKVTDHRTVIDWFYLNGLSMAQTADKMNMSERTAYYLKDDALEAFGIAMRKK
ncbi:MAG: DUF1492 domain-containing protein [Lachnospiraceae bacterium]|nr:DUF1492 domain-containing protein [Lachnospiraceae bacterium]